MCTGTEKHARTETRFLGQDNQIETIRANQVKVFHRDISLRANQATRRARDKQTYTGR